MRTKYLFVAVIALLLFSFQAVAVDEPEEKLTESLNVIEELNLTPQQVEKLRERKSIMF